MAEARTHQMIYCLGRITKKHYSALTKHTVDRLCSHSPRVTCVQLHIVRRDKSASCRRIIRNTQVTLSTLYVCDCSHNFKLKRGIISRALHRAELSVTCTANSWKSTPTRSVKFNRCYAGLWKNIWRGVIAHLTLKVKLLPFLCGVESQKGSNYSRVVVHYM